MFICCLQSSHQNGAHNAALTLLRCAHFFRQAIIAQHTEKIKLFHKKPWLTNREEYGKMMGRIAFVAYYEKLGAGNLL